MAEQVIMEFVGSTEGLKPAFDAMVALGSLSKEQMAAFTKANTDANKLLAQRATATKQLATEEKKLSEATQADAKGLQELNKSTKELAGTVANGATKEFTGQIIEQGKQVGSLKAQLRAMKEELSAMEEAGQDGSQAFEDLAVNAAQLEDQIGDTNERIRQLASDTRGFDLAVEGVRGVAGAFTLAQSASALFGQENEDLQKGLLKMQAVTGGLMATQELATIVTKKGGIATEAYGFALKAVEAISERTGWSIAASWAVATGGITLVIAALAALYYGLGQAERAAAKEALELEKLKRLRSEEVSLLGQISAAQKQTSDSKIRDIQANIELMKAAGASTADIRKEEERLDQARVDAAVTQNELFKTRIDNFIQYKNYYLKKQADMNQEILGMEEDLAKGRSEIINGKNVYGEALQAEIEQKKKQYKNLSDEIAQVTAVINELDDAFTAQQVNSLNRSKAQTIEDLDKNIEAIQLRLTKTAEGTEKELQLRTKLIYAESAKKKEVLVKDAAYEINLEKIKYEAYKQISDLRIPYAEKLAQQGYNAEVAGLKAILATSLELSQEHLDAQLELIDLEAGAETAARTKGLSDKKQILAIAAEVEAEATKKRIAAQIAFYAQVDALRKKDADAELAHATAVNDLVQNDPYASYKQKKKAAHDFLQFKISQDLAEITSESAKFQKELAIEGQSNSQKQALRKEHNAKMTELSDKLRKHEQEQQRLTYEEQIAIIKQVGVYAIQTAQHISDTLLANAAEARQQELDTRLKQLDEQMNAELDNENNTAAQKKAIQKRYHDLEAAEKLKAWKADQEAKAGQAVINGLLGFTMALATLPPPGSFIAGALAIATAGVEAALIMSKKPPAFEKGGKNIPAGMKIVGEKGPELLWTPGGETVIPHADTAKLLEKWNIPLPNLANGKTDMAIGPAMPVGIDYRLMAKSFAEELRNNPMLHVQIDKHGTIVRSIEKGRIVEHLNDSYNG